MTMLMPRTEAMEVHGTVLDSLPNATFHVALDNGHRVVAQTAIDPRFHSVKLAPGDKVTVEISPYDLGRGRITYRSK
jgi:translation initiation factor IF-1